MKNLKTYKYINNLPKYDLGTKPIDKGYQLGDLLVSIGSVDLLALSADPMIKAQRQLNISDLISNGIATGTSIYGMLPTITKGGMSIAESNLPSITVGASTAGNAATVGAGGVITNAGTAGTVGEITSTNASGATGTLASNAVSKGLGAIGAALGAYQLATGFKNQRNNGVSYGEMEQMSGKNTQYAGDQAYDVYSGMDVSGMNKYLKEQNTGSTINNVLNGAGMGAGIGSLIVPGVGTVIGGLGGALIGGIGSAIFGKKARDRQEEYIRKTIEQQSAYNQQSESEALSRSMRADKGYPNFRKTGKDDQLLDIIKPGKDIIFGKKINERTGNTYDQDAAMLGAPTIPVTPWTPERMDNIKTTVNGKPALVSGGEAVAKAGDNPLLDALAILQAMTPDNNPNPYEMKRNSKRRKYDLGNTTAYSIIPAMMGLGAGAHQYFSYKREDPMAYDTYVENPNAYRANQVLSGLHYDPYNQLQAANDATRFGQYAINNSPYSAGQRMVMNSQLFNDRMKNYAAIYDKAQEMNNAYKTQYADSLLKSGQDAATRKQQSNVLRRDMYAKAVATRRRGMEQAVANSLNPIYSMFSNLNNNYWTDKNIKLWYDDLRRNNMNTNKEKNTKTKTPKNTAITQNPEMFNEIMKSPYGLAWFNNYNRYKPIGI